MVPGHRYNERAPAEDTAERSRLADELARREKELAGLEAEKQRLAEERRNVEQALAARLGTLVPSSPDRSAQPQATPASAPRSTERRADTPAAGAPGKANCSELLLRAQLGDLTPLAREQLQQCR